MKVELNGMTALVTGSSAGIGYAIARTLAQNGARVAVNGRTPERVAEAIEHLKQDAAGGAFVSAPGDVGTAEGCEAVADAAGEVDILVNNAAWIDPRPPFEVPDEHWTRSFEVNVLSGVRLTRRLAPGMKARGFGRVVFISSESGVQIPTDMMDYGFSKAGQLAVMRGFAQALERSGVTVNAVLPGPTHSEGVTRFIDRMAEDQGVDAATVERDFFAHARPTSILKRFTEPEEIAAVVAFLCSREASAVTGSPVRADGGVVQSIT